MNFKRLTLSIALLLLSVCSYAQTDLESYSQKRLMRQLKYTAANLMNIGMGVTAEGMWNYGAGIKVGWKGGNERQLLNITAGMEYLWHNPVHISKKHHSIAYEQFAPYIGVRVNYTGLKIPVLYAEADISYCLNHSSKYRSGQHTITSPLTRNHHAPVFRIGYEMEDIEFCCYARYDMKPSIRQEYIYDNEPFDYFKLGPAINERWTIGISLFYYIVR